MGRHKVNVLPVSRLRKGDPLLQPPICHRPTLLTTTCALVRRPVARHIRCEFIAIHPGRGFTHEKGLIFSSPHGAWSYTHNLPSSSPWQIFQFVAALCQYWGRHSQIDLRSICLATDFPTNRCWHTISTFIETTLRVAALEPIYLLTFLASPNARNISGKEALSLVNSPLNHIRGDLDSIFR